MFLSDLGAEVIKVEDPTTGGDEARAVPPFSDPGARDGLYYQSLNRGARSITLNLRTPEGRDLLHRLVGRADAVYNNMRGDLPGKLGLDYAALKTANPRVVCCSLSGFGRTGPRAGDPGYDYLLQAYAGFMSVSGEPDAPPTKCGGSIVIMCMKEKFWERLVERIGLAHLRDDPRFGTFADRLAHRDALRPILGAEFRRHTTAEWLERLRGRVPIAPVYAVEEALADEQVLAREMVVAVDHPRFGRLREVGCPIKMGGVAPRYAPAAPLGADTAAVLAEVGIGPGELEELRRRGAGELRRCWNQTL